MSEDNKQKLKIFITGHRGFIASKIFNRLTAQGHAVVGIDTEDGQDLLDTELLESRIKNSDVVYHLAAQADLNKMTETLGSARDGIRTNVYVTETIANLCTKYNKWLIFASTVCVYGNVNKNSIEDETLPKPSELYACSKYAAEWIIKGYSKSFGLQYTILRFATIHGEGMRPALGVSVFLNQALNQLPITVHGDGKQVRTLTYVEDLVDGCVSVIQNKEKSLNEIINLSAKEPISANKMAEDIKRLTGSTSDIVHIGQRKNQTVHEKISVRKARRILGWKAKTSWEEGLEATYRWVKETQSIKS